VRAEARGVTLDGCRVLDFGHVWAAPFATQVLSDLGAEVVRVDSRLHSASHRRAGPYGGGEPDINASAVWNAQNRGKLGCTLNLKDPRGLELARDLVRASDVVFENFVPGTFARLGLGYDELRELNPRIILVSLSGYGQTGPWSTYPAYGPMMDAVGGLAFAARSPGGVPQSVNGWFPDTSAALFGALAAVMAFTEAGASGVGQHIDVSQLESTLCLLPELLMAENDGEGVRSNASDTGAERLVLPTGDDEWIALVLRDGDRPAVEGVLGLPPDGNLATGLLGRDRETVCAALQMCGIEAVPVLSAPELLSDSHLDARGAMMDAVHPRGGPFRSYGPVLREEGDAPARDRAPLLGEHNAYVFGEILGLSTEEQAELEGREVLW
jgi:benzylsuccinate CoA-transferase BbsF subunit